MWGCFGLYALRDLQDLLFSTWLLSSRPARQCENRRKKNGWKWINLRWYIVQHGVYLHGRLKTLRGGWVRGDGVYFLPAAPPDWSWKINQRLPFGMNQLQSEEDAPFSPVITSFSSATGSQIPALPACLGRNDWGGRAPPPPHASSHLLLAWRLSGHRGPETGGLCQLLVWAGREEKKRKTGEHSFLPIY